MKKDNNISETRKEELLLKINKVDSFMILNVPPNNSKIALSDDPVEYALNEKERDFPIITVENQREYDFVLSNLSSSLKDLVITGAHGSKKGTLGNIQPEGIGIVLNTELNIFFPDCYMGNEKTMTKIQRTFGPQAKIYAMPYATSEIGVTKFLRKILTTNNPNSDYISAQYLLNVKEVKY